MEEGRVSVTKLVDCLPRDLQLLIGKMVHVECLDEVNSQFKNLFKVGVSVMITKNNDYGEKRRKKIFAFLDIDNTTLRRRAKFYEIARDVEDVPSVKGWERTPYNYRNLSSHFNKSNIEDMNPRTFCIRNGFHNVGVLPRRYFYSKPIDMDIYLRLKTDVEHFVKTVPISATIRGGKL